VFIQPFRKTDQLNPLFPRRLGIGRIEAEHLVEILPRRKLSSEELDHRGGASADLYRKEISRADYTKTCAVAEGGSEHTGQKTRWSGLI